MTVRHRYRLVFPLLLLLVTGTASATLFLQDFSGKTKLIEDYLDHEKWLIVMFWASDCHVCNQEAQAYIGFHEKNKATRARVLGVSMDGTVKRAAAEAFIKRHQVSFPNLIGDPQAIATEYQLLSGRRWLGTPSFMIFSPDGQLRAAETGAVPVDVIERFIGQHR